jgi:hypothetical protein
MPNFLIHPLFIFFITNTVKPAFVVYKAVTCIQGWSWLENKITEINEKIAETIYTPFQSGHFLPVLTMSSNFWKIIFIGK